MKFHDELNQKLFNKEELKPEVKEKLKEIAEAFIDYLEVNKDAIKDVVITGSSVSYNYTKYSDIDLHLKVDYDLIHEDCPIVEGYLWACKSTFNKDHDITIYGIPVEVYAESIEEDTVHNGLYSLWQDKWIDKPNKIPPTDNDSAVLSKYNELKEAADRIQDSEVASELIDKIYQMRKAGLQEAGEFSTENLAFKKLRDEGIIERLREMKKQKIDKELSLESYKESVDSIVIDNYLKMLRDGGYLFDVPGCKYLVQVFTNKELQKLIEFNDVRKAAEKFIEFTDIYTKDEDVVLFKQMKDNGKDIKTIDSTWLNVSNKNESIKESEETEFVENPKELNPKYKEGDYVCFYDSYNQTNRIGKITRINVSEIPGDPILYYTSYQIEHYIPKHVKLSWGSKSSGQFYYAQMVAETNILNLVSEEDYQKSFSDNISQSNDTETDSVAEYVFDVEYEDTQADEWGDGFTSGTLTITKWSDGTYSWYADDIDDGDEGLKSIAQCKKAYKDYLKEGGFRKIVITQNKSIKESQEELIKEANKITNHGMLYMPVRKLAAKLMDRVKGTSDEEALKVAKMFFKEAKNESTGELAVFAKRRFSNVTGKPQKDFYRETDYKLNSEDAEKWINKDMGYDRPGIIYQIRDKEGNVIKEVKWTDIYHTKEHYDEAIKYLYKYGTMDQIAYVLRLANPDIPQEKIDKKIEQLKAAKEYEDIHQQLVRCSIAGIEPSAATRERSAELRRYLDKNESIKEELEEKEYQGCKYTILPDGKYCSIKIYAPKGYSFKNGDTWYSTETELKKADKKAKDIIDNEIELKESINNLEETLKKATDMEINEGMWASPFTMENAKQVAELLSKPITYKELNSEEGKQKYWNIIGDDEFWDNVADEAFDIPEADARYLIVKFLEDWIETKENFNADAYSQKAEDIIKKAIFMFNGITEDMSKSIKEDRLFNKQLTPLPSKDAKLNKGDKVTIDGQNGEIIEVRPMKMSDTCTYKIKLDNGKVIWRYEEEIINEEVKTSSLQKTISRALTESEGIYKPSLIYAAYKLEQQWLKSLGLGQDEQAPEIMLFVINNPEEGIEDTKLVKREDVYTYTPEQNEYYLDMTRDSGDVITDYNLEPAAKLVDSWNLKEDAQTLTDKVDKAEQELQDIIKMVKVGYQEDNKLINNLNKLINEALEK